MLFARQVQGLFNCSGAKGQAPYSYDGVGREDYRFWALANNCYETPQPIGCLLDGSCPYCSLMTSNVNGVTNFGNPYLGLITPNQEQTQPQDNPEYTLYRKDGTGKAFVIDCRTVQTYGNESTPYSLYWLNNSEHSWAGCQNRRCGYQCIMDWQKQPPLQGQSYDYNSDMYMRNWNKNLSPSVSAPQLSNWYPATNDGGVGNKLDCCTTPINTEYIREKSCPPEYWAGSPLCDKTMYDYCTNPKNYDKNKHCSAYFSQLLDIPEPSSVVNPTTFLQSGNAKNLGINKVKNIISSLLENVKTKNDLLSISDILIDYGTDPKLRGKFDTDLQRVCSVITRDETKDAKNGETLRRICGCFLPSDQYLLTGILEPECDSICSLNNCNIDGTTGYCGPVSGTITPPSTSSKTYGIVRSEWDGNGYTPRTCKQNSCVISDVKTYIDASNVPSLDFSQICASSGKSPGTHTCIINDVSLDIAHSTVGGALQFQQNCLNCAEYVPKTGKLTPVDCVTKKVISSGGAPVYIHPKEYKKRVENVLGSDVGKVAIATSISVILFIALLALGYYLYSQTTTPVVEVV